MDQGIIRTLSTQFKKMLKIFNQLQRLSHKNEHYSPGVKCQKNPLKIVFGSLVLQE